MPLNLNLLDNSHSNGPGTYSVMKCGEKINAILCGCECERERASQSILNECEDAHAFLIVLYTKTLTHRIIVFVCLCVHVTVHCVYAVPFKNAIKSNIQY